MGDLERWAKERGVTLKLGKAYGVTGGNRSGSCIPFAGSRRERGTDEITINLGNDIICQTCGATAPGLILRWVKTAWYHKPCFDGTGAGRLRHITRSERG